MNNVIRYGRWYTCYVCGKDSRISDEMAPYAGMLIKTADDEEGICDECLMKAERKYPITV